MALSKIDSDGIVSGGITADSLNIGQIGGRRNLIINGAQVIDQRNAGASVNTANAVVYVTDRWFFIENSSETATTQQVTDAPDGFTHSFKFTNSATPTTPSYGQLVQNIEGYNVAHLDYGTSSAKTVTVSFWVKSSVTGDYSICLRNGASNRSIVSTYTINTANTWEYKTKTFVGDTTGTWATDNTNGLSLIYRIAGSGGTATLDSWVTGDVFASGAVNIMGTASATWQITGVQLEVGTVATPFEHRSYGEELALCQRYYIVIAEGNARPIGSGALYTGGYLATCIDFPVEMRAYPSFEQVTGSNYFTCFHNGNNDPFDGFSGVENTGTNKFFLYRNTQISGTAGNAAWVISNNASAKLAFESEL